MRRILIPTLLATLGFASAAHGEGAPPAAFASADLFTISDVKVDATGLSPRAARDLAMAQGRPLAWSTLFHRLTVEDAWASQPELADGQILGLIGSADVGNERHNTTRYLADVKYHFNPAAVRQLLRESNIASTEVRVANERAPYLVRDGGSSNRLATHVRFDTMADWAKLRARLKAVDTIAEMDVVDLDSNEAQIGLIYSGQVEQLGAAMAQQDLELNDSGGEYTLELRNVAAADFR